MSRETFIELAQERTIALPFKLMRTGKVDSRVGVNYDICDHGHIEFCLRLSSSEEYAVDEVGGRMVRLHFPHLFVKRPNTRHKYTIYGQRKAIFMIYPSELQPLFDRIGMRTDINGFEFIMTDSLKEKLERYCELFPISQEFGVAERFDLMALDILADIYLQQHGMNYSEPDVLEEAIRSSASFIQLEFLRTDVLEEAINRFGFSRRSFFRYWKKYYKNTPTQYVIDLRMQEAKRLLSRRDLSIQDISERLNFSSSSYFTQAFKRCFNCSPREYRRKE